MLKKNFLNMELVSSIPQITSKASNHPSNNDPSEKTLIHYHMNC